MKGELTRIMLNILQNTGYATSEIFDIFTSGYAESYRKLRGIPSPVRTPSDKQRLYNLIAHLQKQGLVAKHKSKNKIIIYITEKGKQQLQKIQESLKKRLPIKSYPAIKSRVLTIVSFDIPETHRFKRDWLRLTLQRLGYTMIHKSVWIGKNLLPAEFMEDLNEYKLIPHIHIFQVAQSGTIVRS